MQTRKRLRNLKVLSATLLLAGSGSVLAANKSVTAYVTRVLLNADSTFGGCMVELSEDPRSVLPGCRSGWVSFSCSGDFTDPVRAYRMLDAAELALAAGKQVWVRFQDDKRHNNYCFANRIDVLD
jgi:hypothetical protein